MDKKNEQSVRIQTSILNPIEKKVLVWMAERMPSFVTSDMLTWIGTLGAFIVGLGFALTNYSIAGFWLASLGLVINWFGDSLDGTLARVKQQQRPLYGFYIDHNMDCICQLLIFGGAGLSPYLNLWLALLLYAAYMMLEIYVMICAHLKNEFRLTYGKLGPTEFRALIVVLNTLLVLLPGFREFHVSFTLVGEVVTFYTLDMVCLILFFMVLSMYMISFVKDARYFAKIDPLRKHEQ